MSNDTQLVYNCAHWRAMNSRNTLCGIQLKWSPPARYAEDPGQPWDVEAEIVQWHTYPQEPETCPACLEASRSRGPWLIKNDLLLLTPEMEAEQRAHYQKLSDLHWVEFLERTKQEFEMENK